MSAMECSAASQSGPASRNDPIDAFCQVESFSVMTGVGEGAMNGVNEVMLLGKCRSRIWDEGSICNTCAAEVGGPEGDETTGATLIDIEASRLALRSCDVRLGLKFRVGDGKGSPTCTSRCSSSSKLPPTFLFSNTARTRLTVSSNDLTDSPRTAPISSLSFDTERMEALESRLDRAAEEDSGGWRMSRIVLVRCERNRARASEIDRLSRSMMASRVSERDFP